MIIEPKFTINDMVGLNKLGRETYPSIAKSIFTIFKVINAYGDNEITHYIIEIKANADDSLINQKLTVSEEYLCLAKKRQIEITEEQINQLNNHEITIEDVLNSSVRCIK
jgi:hypothetical protein